MWQLACLYLLAEHGPDSIAITSMTNLNARRISAVHGLPATTLNKALGLGMLYGNLTVDELEKRIRSNKGAYLRIRRLQWLAADELGLLSALHLDLIDAALRRIRGSPARWGGIRVLTTVSFTQGLPWLSRDHEKDKIPLAAGQPLFNASTFASTFRLADTFMLAGQQRVSDGRGTSDLLTRLQFGFTLSRDVLALTRQWGSESRAMYAALQKDPTLPCEGFLIITFKTKDVAAINKQFLDKLPGETRRVMAVDDGPPEFKPRDEDVPPFVDLKVGARVRLTFSLPATPAGTAGTVLGIFPDSPEGKPSQFMVRVRLDGDGATPGRVADVRACPFMTEDGKGNTRHTRFAMPLELNWAATAPSSQGATARYLVVIYKGWCGDNNMYVALSRGVQASRIAFEGKWDASASAHNLDAIAFTLELMRRKQPKEYEHVENLRGEWEAEVKSQPGGAERLIKHRESMAAATKRAHDVLAAMDSPCARGATLSAATLDAVARFGWGGPGAAAAAAAGAGGCDSALSTLLQMRGEHGAGAGASAAAADEELLLYGPGRAPQVASKAAMPAPDRGACGAPFGLGTAAACDEEAAASHEEEEIARSCESGGGSWSALPDRVLAMAAAAGGSAAPTSEERAVLTLPGSQHMPQVALATTSAPALGAKARAGTFARAAGAQVTAAAPSPVTAAYFTVVSPVLQLERTASHALLHTPLLPGAGDNRPAQSEPVGGKQAQSSYGRPAAAPAPASKAASLVPAPPLQAARQQPASFGKGVSGSAVGDEASLTGHKRPRPGANVSGMTVCSVLKNTEAELSSSGRNPLAATPKSFSSITGKAGNSGAAVPSCVGAPPPHAVRPLAPLAAPKSKTGGATGVAALHQSMASQGRLQPSRGMLQQQRVHVAPSSLGAAARAPVDASRMAKGR